MITDPAPHLTSAEVSEMRDALASRRAPGSYEPGKWAVSPYNRQPEVLGAARRGHYPRSVVIRDITLRVIEQAPGVTATLAQRRRLGAALVAAGVSSLEISAHGWRQSADDLKDQISQLKSIRPDLEVKMGASMNESMIDKAAYAGVTLAEFWLPALPEITPLYWSEAYRLAWQGKDWRQAGIPASLDDAIETGTRLTRHIRSLGLRASAGVNLLTLVNDDYLERYCTAMVRAGVQQIWLSDGPSGLSPEAWVHVVALVRQLAPDCQIGIYTRNIFGLALANLLECVHAGAHIVEASVNGIAAGAGLADTAQVASALEILYGVNTGIDLSRLAPLARLVEDISGVPLAANHAITGRSAHDWGGTEISVQELKVEPLLHWPFEPSLVGHRKEWSISVTSGMWTLRDKLDELGISVPHDDMPAVLARILAEIGIRGRSLSDDEIADVASSPQQ